MTLKDKIAVVTGASSGIGRAIAQEFAKEGVFVILTARRKDELNKTKVEIESKGGKAEIFVADIADRRSIRELAHKISSNVDKVDFLFNVAGVGYYKSIEDITPEQWDTAVAVNLSAPLFLTKELLPLLKSSSDSIVFNIGSGLGVNPIYPERVDYITTKFGLRGFSLSLSRYFKGKSPKVCLITLGSVLTNFGPGGLEGRIKKQKEGRKYYSPEWIAQKLIEFIKSDDIKEEITLLPAE